MSDLFPETVPDVSPDEAFDERYTTRETMEWVKRVANVDAFDLDVAACKESHWAPKYFTKSDNGLTKPWFGRVWCNPPYSDIEPWVTTTWAALSTEKKVQLVAMLVPATRTEQAWWQTWIEPFRDGRDYGEGRPLMAMDASPVELTTHFLPGRTSFARPGSGGVGQSGAPFGCVLIVWRSLRPPPKKRKLEVIDVISEGT